MCLQTYIYIGVFYVFFLLVSQIWTLPLTYTIYLICVHFVVERVVYIICLLNIGAKQSLQPIIYIYCLSNNLFCLLLVQIFTSPLHPRISCHMHYGLGQDVEVVQKFISNIKYTLLVYKLQDTILNFAGPSKLLILKRPSTSNNLLAIFASYITKLTSE